MEKKKSSTVWIVIIVGVLIVGFVAFILNVVNGDKHRDRDDRGDVPEEEAAHNTPAFATYTIEGNQFTLRDGIASHTSILNSAVGETVALMGEPTVVDVTGDGNKDAIVILKHEPGGTGSFYYVAVAFRQDDTYVTSSAILLGDRVVISGVDTTGEGFNVRYLDRRLDQDFSVQPTIPITARFAVNKQTLSVKRMVDVAPSQMSNADKLLGAPWRWVKTDIAHKIDTPLRPNVFSLTFNLDGTFSVTTDCNSMGGMYTATHTILQLSNIHSTMMVCEGSQESNFVRMLPSTQTYRFDALNYLVLEFYGGETHLTR